MAEYKKRADGRYRADIVVGVREDGKAKKQTVYAYSISELRNKIAEIKHQTNTGTYANDSGYTVGEWADKWLAVYKTRIAKNTKANYQNIIKNHMNDIKHIRLKDLKKTDIQMAINKLDGHDDLQKLLKITINQMLETAIDDGLIFKNVSRTIQLQRTKKSDKRALTDAELNAIKTADLTLKQRAFVSILLYTGARRGEVLALTQRDIDLKNDIIHIRQSLAFESNKSYIKDTKSESGKREIDILSSLKPILIEYINSIDTIYLFTNKQGGVMSKTSYRRMWDSLYNKLNIAAGGTPAVFERGKMTIKVDLIKGLTPHTFRHNYATMLYYAGVDIKDAQRLLGHSDSKTTIDIYTHLDRKKSNSKSKLENYASNI